jgi:hypothetical protein
MPAVRPLAVALLVLALCPAAAHAQDNYEIQVYGSETVDPGATMVELHSNYTFDGLTTTADSTFPANHALHETVEVTHGFNSWLEIGFYLFTSVQPNGGWKWVGDHVRPRVRVPPSWHWPVGVSLSQEIGYARREFTSETWSWEIRPIIDQKIGRFYWSFNPVLSVALSGPASHEAPVFAPNAKISWDLIPQATVGLEYYGSLGAVSGFAPSGQQVHAIFPSLDLNLSPRWEFNAGVGLGLTDATDKVVAKVIVGRRFGR